jgi:ribosome-associated toxin RatA of RatAB toxin-antitoxin module
MIARSLPFLRRAAAASLVLGALWPASASGDDLPAKGQVEVKKVAVSGSDAPKFVVRAVMELPPKKVWAVVSDCAHYKERMPHIAASELVKKDGKVHTCKVTIKMPFPLSNLTATTEATHEESERQMSRRWKLVSGDYKVNEGSWEVRAVDEAGTSSLVTYTVHAEPNSAVPDWIRESAQAKALPELMERVKAEAAKMP